MSTLWDYGCGRVGKVNNEFLGIETNAFCGRSIGGFAQNYFSGVVGRNGCKTRSFLFVVHIISLANDERCYIAVRPVLHVD